MGRPLQVAVEEQGKQIKALLNTVEQLVHSANRANQTITAQALTIDYIGKVAGITPEIVAIRTEAFKKSADAMNPAQPVPDPPSQPAVETTEQAATPEAYDDPQNPGQTPGSVQHLPADATGTVMDPGTTLPTAPYNNLIDVQAPVAGTETHVPLDQTRTEVDVRVGNPMNPQPAYPWTIASGQNRTMASMRLARLRIQAGTARGDDLTVAASIEADASLSDQAIASEVATLDGVMRAAGSRTAAQRPAGAVPRPAGQVQRTTPSLVSQAGLSTQAMGASSVSEDMECSDLFD